MEGKHFSPQEKHGSGATRRNIRQVQCLGAFRCARWVAVSLPDTMQGVSQMMGVLWALMALWLPTLSLRSSPQNTAASLACLSTGKQRKSMSCTPEGFLQRFTKSASQVRLANVSFPGPPLRTNRSSKGRGVVSEPSLGRARVSHLCLPLAQQDVTSSLASRAPEVCICQGCAFWGPRWERGSRTGMSSQPCPAICTGTPQLTGSRRQDQAGEEAGLGTRDTG